MNILNTFFPHDVQVREIGNFGKSRLESLLELGIAYEVTAKAVN